MNKFLLGMSVVGNFSNGFAGAIADGKATLEEMVDVAETTTQGALTATGQGRKVVYTLDADGPIDPGEVGRRVGAAVQQAFDDGSLDLSDVVHLSAVVTKEVLRAAGIDGKVVVDAAA